MKNWQHILLGIFLGVALTAGMFFILNKPTGASIQLKPAPEQKIKVYLSGSAIKPGLYELRQGSRVNDLLTLSGDLQNKPDLHVNLARILSDGEEVYLPEEPSKQDISVQSAQPLISLNKATLSELDTLPGIGETRAQAILDYREQHGSFTSLDELSLIPGLSEEVIQGIKPLLTIE